MKELILQGLDEKIYFYETKCGLKMYMWVNEKITSMYATLSVKYGSIHTKFKIGKKTYETPNGIAHFLEHIKFNINEFETAHDRFYKLGGDANAFTTFDYTSYLIYTTKNKKESLKELISFVYNPYFTKKDIAKEKGIIIEEAKMGLDDKYAVMFYEHLQNTLQKSKYRYTITGTPKDVEKINLDDIKLVFDAFYHPNNMFIVITGNFNPYEMINAAEEAFDSIEFKEYQNPVVILENEPRKVTKKYTESKKDITYPSVKVTLKTDISKFKNFSKLNLKVLTNILFDINFGMTSDFKNELIEKGIIQNLSVFNDIYDNVFIITITASTYCKDEFIRLLKEKLSNLSVSDAEFIRKKNASIATLILDYEDLENVSYKLQYEILNFGNILTSFKETLQNLQVSDVENLIDLIDTNNMAITVFLPNENQKEE